MKNICSIALAVLAASFLAAGTGFTQAPNAVIDIEAWSPQEIHDLGWQSPPSNGLRVVGKGELVYLFGREAAGEEITSLTWSFESVPSGSNAALDSTATQRTTFRPDTTGEFVVSLAITTASGTAETTVNMISAYYVGVGTVGGLTPDISKGQCAPCHGSNKDQWELTGHATMFELAIDGLKSSHYNESCIECHTVGFNEDPTAVNDGFDDIAKKLGWTFPEKLEPGNWDRIVGGGASASGKLNAVGVEEAPVVDGVIDEVWNKAPALNVALGETYDVHDPASIMDCAGCHAIDSEISVTLKAVYTNDQFFILATWPDPTASFTRGGSWSFADGSWQKPNSAQSEDRISFFWPIGEITGNPFNTGGCMTKCHTYWPTDTDPHQSTHGIVDDAWLESGRGDMWHSKAARGGAYLSAIGSNLTIDPTTHEVTAGEFSMIGFADDKYVDIWQPDSINGEDGGRYGDSGSSAYSHNRIGDKSRPKFMEKNPVDFADAMTLTQDEIDAGEVVGDPTIGVSDADATTYWPAYAALDAIVPERILRAPAGSRSDLAFGAVWSNGYWTAEIARDLDTGNDDDIQFDPTKEYLFGVAAFENSRHGYEHRTSDTYSLVFDAGYPELAHRANIQCENCHGPGNLHKGNKANIDMTLSFGMCARCHDEEPYHRRPAQWKASGHARGDVAFAANREDCAPCHSGRGFVNRVDPDKPFEVGLGDPFISCAVCHDPHNADLPHQVRILDDVTLMNGEVITFGGNGKLCMNCHMSRRDADSYTEEYHPHYGPHLGPQADMLAGTNAIDFGLDLPSSGHKNAVEDACVTCHMWPTPAPGQPGRDLIGDHTFAMHAEENGVEVENVAPCQSCHGNISSFDDIMAKFDYDGNGVKESARKELMGLMDEVGKLLPPIGDPSVVVTADYTKLQLKTAYNYLFVEEDHSYGMHNYQYAIALLKAAQIVLTTGDIGAGAIQSITDVPNDQGKQVRIVWTKFGGDGVTQFPIKYYALWRRVDDMPATGKNAAKKVLKSYASFADAAPDIPTMAAGQIVSIAGNLWDFAGQVPAAGLEMYSAIAPTLLDSTKTDGMHWSVFVVSGHAEIPAINAVSQPDSGYSIDNLVPATPANIQGMETEAGVEMTWEEPVDADFKYFAIYRDTSPAFDPTGSEPLATTTDPNYRDAEVQVGATYYYKVSAFDFSGNESPLSEELAILITSIPEGVPGTIPSDFALEQNYPNPFNPSTVIRFGIPTQAEVRVIVYNLLGVPIRTLASGQFAAGYHRLIWDGRDDFGRIVGAGTYLYRLETNEAVQVKKMIFIK